MKVIHVGGWRWGGVQTFIKSIMNLNENSSIVHDLLLLNKDSETPNLPQSGEIHNIEYRKMGMINSAICVFSIFKNYDGILVHSFHPVIVPALLFMRKKRKLFFQHGMTVSHGSLIKRKLKKIFYSLLPILSGANVICSTPYAMKKMREKGIHFSEDLFRIIPFGVELTERNIDKNNEFPKKCIKIGLAGRFVPEKRFHWVLDSFSDYHGQIKFIIDIAGSGPEEANLKALANKISSNIVEVNFLGELSDMTSFYSKLDLVVFPSKDESFGYVVLEALVFNIPVVIFKDVGGALVLVKDQKNGFILNKKRDLLALWHYFCENQEILHKQNEYIRKMDLTEFDIQNTKCKLEKLLTD